MLGALVNEEEDEQLGVTFIVLTDVHTVVIFFFFLSALVKSMSDILAKGTFLNVGGSQ